MKEVMNTWRKEPATWMNPESLMKVTEMKNQQDYQQGCKKRFNSILFELSATKVWLRLLLEFR